MKFINVKGIEKFHPGYKDRKPTWMRLHFNMTAKGSLFNDLCDIDKWRLIAFSMLQLEQAGPVKADENYLAGRGFDVKARPLEKTLRALDGFIDILDDQVTLSILSPEPVDERDKKKIFMEHVKLTDNEYQSLMNIMGIGPVSIFIERLNNYIGQIGPAAARKYKSHKHTILNWWNRETKKAVPGGNNRRLDKEAEREIIERNLKKWSG